MFAVVDLATPGLSISIRDDHLAGDSNKYVTPEVRAFLDFVVEKLGVMLAMACGRTEARRGGREMGSDVG